MRLILVEKLKEAMIFFLEKNSIQSIFLKICLFIWDTLTKNDGLFILDCDFQQGSEQVTMFKVALPMDFPRIHRGVPSGSQNVTFPWPGGLCWFVLVLNYNTPLTLC